ncbi:MAG: flagellar type III secretion system pore protein FliP [Pirellulales bacterium]
MMRGSTSRCSMKWGRAAQALLLILIGTTSVFGQANPATVNGPASIGPSAPSIAASPTFEDGLRSIVRGNSPGDGLLSDSENRIDNGDPERQSAQNFLLSGPEKWTSREGLSSSLQIVLLLTVLSLAPAVLLMTTCYVRIIVVLGLLRQALGTGQLPPSQVVTSISLFMTLFVMTPVWNRVYQDAIAPYTAPGSQMSMDEAWNRGIGPIRDFMSRPIDMAGNHDDVHLFHRYYAPDSPSPTSFEEVPLRVLLPAYMLSELKTAFLMGFQIYLPFLLIDLVVAAVTISMGMMMLPPAMISLPFKLLLFVLIDGWHLVVGMLLESFGTIT